KCAKSPMTEPKCGPGTKAIHVGDYATSVHNETAPNPRDNRNSNTSPGPCRTIDRHRSTESSLEKQRPQWAANPSRNPANWTRNHKEPDSWKNNYPAPGNWCRNHQCRRRRNPVFQLAVEAVMTGRREWEDWLDWLTPTPSRVKAGRV